MSMEILVGPIASGKSTYAKKEAGKGALIVNDDAIVTAVHGGHYLLYDESLKPLYKSIENTIIQMGLLLNRTVIIDRPNYSRITRMRYIGLAKSLDKNVIVIEFPDEGVEVHAKRRVKDSRGYPLDYWKKVYLRHQSLYDEPDMFTEELDSLVFFENGAI